MAEDGKVECPLPPKPRFWTRHRAALLMLAFALYTVALGVAVLDEALHLGLFPTDMESHARVLIEEFDSRDPQARAATVARFFQEIEGFVAVPELIRALGAASPQRRAVANDCLKQLTQSDQGFDPHAASADRKAAIARWRAWWVQDENQRRF